MISSATIGPNSGRTTLRHERRYLAIVVSEYGFPLPRRRPIVPASTPSIHSSPRLSSVAPGWDRPASNSAASSESASQVRTSARFSVALPHIGLPVVGCRGARDRTDCSGSAGRPPHTRDNSAHARRRYWRLGPTEAQGHPAPNHTGVGWTQMSRRRQVSGGSLRSGACEVVLLVWRSRAPPNRGRLGRCRRRDSNPRHADYDSAALTD